MFKACDVAFTPDDRVNLGKFGAVGFGTEIRYLPGDGLEKVYQRADIHKLHRGEGFSGVENFKAGLD